MNQADTETRQVTRIDRRQVSEIVRCLVAGVLLTAASMKAVQLYGDYTISSNLATMRECFHIVFEFALALFLVIPVSRSYSWPWFALSCSAPLRSTKRCRARRRAGVLEMRSSIHGIALRWMSRSLSCSWRSCQPN